MENERRLNARDREAERTQFERRITELSQRYKNKSQNLYKNFKTTSPENRITLPE